MSKRKEAFQGTFKGMMHITPKIRQYVPSSLSS